MQAYGLPARTTTLEGWLFPATYPINPGWSAKQYFQSMVDTMKQHLAAAGVAEADQERVIIFASLVQKEAGVAADFPKVARVFQNRLDQGMALQSDATVAYGTGNTHTVTTTTSAGADAGNKYNTYQHKGLPPAPISNPGDVAIKAVTQPASGSWLYFVTVNLETGETVFLRHPPSTRPRWRSSGPGCGRTRRTSEPIGPVRRSAAASHGGPLWEDGRHASLVDRW